MQWFFTPNYNTMTVQAKDKQMLDKTLQSDPTLELLHRFRDAKPAIIFEWHDSKTDAEGWVVINSLRGGAAGGGTRMRKGLNKEEVISLAKIMEIKFSVSGPPIGGAKSGINFDPADPRRDEVLRRWFKAVTPLLKHYYGTGGDLNVDELKQVIPITEDYGLWHPQEGVVRGHFMPRDNEKIRIIGQLRQGVSKVVEDARFTPASVDESYKVADLMTGYGVAESVRHFFDIYRQTTVSDKTAVIQGWGNVAGAAGYYLARQGVKIKGIIDRDYGIISKEGLTFEQVKLLFALRQNNSIQPDGLPKELSGKLLPFESINEKIWNINADIFIPGAASKLVSQSQLERLINNGLTVIACGANVPFKDEDLFFGDTTRYADEHCSLIPDFIANCGMARLFAYLMQPNAEVTDEAIFNDVSQTIRNGLFDLYRVNTSRKHLARTALNVALEKLVK